MMSIAVVFCIFVCICSTTANDLIREKDEELYLNKFFCKLLSSNILRCGFKYEPVCGTDNKTYRNYCYLAKSSCESSKPLQLANFGKCKPEDCGRFCTVEYEPVCATNGVTYSNECFFNMALCNAIKKGKGNFSIEHPGKCFACRKFCLKIYKPVCGSDGKTYSNK